MNNLNVLEMFKEPVKRSMLPQIFGCSDRKARKILSELRKDYNIINLQDGKGYVLADNETALKYGLQERKRAIAAFKNANRIIMRCSAPNAGITVPVRGHFRTINKIYVNKNQISLDEMEKANEQSNFNGASY